MQGTNRRSTPNPITPKVISQCKAIYAYTPKLDDELEINPGKLIAKNQFKSKFSITKKYLCICFVGDLIDVHNKQEDGWWIGAIKERVGLFPATYVEEIV